MIAGSDCSIVLQQVPIRPDRIAQVANARISEISAITMVPQFKFSCERSMPIWESVVPRLAICKKWVLIPQERTKPITIIAIMINTQVMTARIFPSKSASGETLTISSSISLESFSVTMQRMIKLAESRHKIITTIEQPYWMAKLASKPILSVPFF